MKQKQIITFVLSSKERLNHSANVINQFKRRDEFNPRIVDKSEYQTSNKMAVFPFTSVQKDFGYSDIFLRDSYRNVDTFDQTSNRIKETIRIAFRFNPH